jgi:molybdate transport system ATP-binding protein
MLEVRLKRDLRDFALDVSFSVRDGQILGLMGENGAGKSTILNLIAGLVEPDAGSIHLGSSVLFDSATRVQVPVERRRIGYVFQRSAVFPHMTVKENVAFGLKARGCDTARVKELTGHWMDAIGIGDLAGVKAADLSGGQKQRVALARALATDPALLMLDEPFTGLDTESIQMVKDAIRHCVSKLHIPCILVTHRIAEARDLGHHGSILSRGRISWEGEVSDIPVNGCGRES